MRTLYEVQSCIESFSVWPQRLRPPRQRILFRNLCTNGSRLAGGSRQVRRIHSRPPTRCRSIEQLSNFFLGNGSQRFHYVINADFLKERVLSTTKRPLLVMMVTSVISQSDPVFSSTKFDKKYFLNY